MTSSVGIGTKGNIRMRFFLQSETVHKKYRESVFSWHCFNDLTTTEPESASNSCQWLFEEGFQRSLTIVPTTSSLVQPSKLLKISFW